MPYIKDLNYRKLSKAIDMVVVGTCKRVDVSPDIKVYAVKNVVRVDLKLSDLNPGNKSEEETC
nr:MAG TPA: hypothetical protein [Caudoviricetes sp.]